MNIFQPTNQIPMTKYEAQKKQRKIQQQQKKQSQSSETTGNTQKSTYIMYAYGSSDDEKKEHQPIFHIAALVSSRLYLLFQTIRFGQFSTKSVSMSNVSFCAKYFLFQDYAGLYFREFSSLILFFCFWLPFLPDHSVIVFTAYPLHHLIVSIKTNNQRFP